MLFAIFHIFEKRKHNTIREIPFDIPYFSLTVWRYMEYDNLYSEGMLYFITVWILPFLCIIFIFMVTIVLLQYIIKQKNRIIENMKIN